MEQLGEFLKSRRGRLTPLDAGLRSYGSRRRVPGLRREELAQLAGVSIAYLTRLEQGQSLNASDAVLDALAGALRLDDDERAHLHDLAKARQRRPRRPRPEQARPMTMRLLQNLTDVPALVLGWRTDILAWNALGHAFFAGHLDPGGPYRPADRPYMARIIFLDPHSRDFYADWKAKTAECVAYLRLAAGRNPDDPALASLIGELSVKSPEFAKLWSARDVRDCPNIERDFHHPLVGDVRLGQEIAHLDGESVQRLVLFHPEPGSASDAALKLLKQIAC
ncbi:helix-turn-helix transcriptional regulator [Actinocorallia longicatena]